MQALSKRLEWVVSGLGAGSEEGRVLCKMAPYILQAVQRVSSATKIPAEDVFGDVLFAFAAAREMYKEDLYRYKGHLYRCTGSEGSSIFLETLKSRKKASAVKVERSEATLVRKAAFYSFLYRGIQQQCADILAAYALDKRCISKKTEPLEEDPSGETMPQSTVFSCDPETLTSAMQLYAEISPRLSFAAWDVLDHLLEDAGATDLSVAMGLNMKVNRVRAARMEICRAYHAVQRELQLDDGLWPIYLKASEAC